MGNSINCCGSSAEDTKKDYDLDAYIKRHHMLKHPHKCPKLSKEDALLHRYLDFPNQDRTFRS
jgi:hypothetical protein